MPLNILLQVYVLYEIYSFLLECWNAEILRPGFGTRGTQAPVCTHAQSEEKKGVSFVS